MLARYASARVNADGSRYAEMPQPMRKCHSAEVTSRGFGGNPSIQPSSAPAVFEQPVFAPIARSATSETLTGGVCRYRKRSATPRSALLSPSQTSRKSVAWDGRKLWRRATANATGGCVSLGRAASRLALLRVLGAACRSSRTSLGTSTTTTATARSISARATRRAIARAQRSAATRCASSRRRSVGTAGTGSPPQHRAVA